MESYSQNPEIAPVAKRVVMLALVAGELTYYEFQGVQKIDKVEGYKDIVLFEPYDLRGRKHLATVHKDPK